MLVDFSRVALSANAERSLFTFCTLTFSRDGLQKLYLNHNHSFTQNIQPSVENVYKFSVFKIPIP